MRTLMLAVMAGLMALPLGAEEVILERIEWTDVWVVNANEPDQRRVLMVGDSIVKGYYGEVEKQLPEDVAGARYATSLFVSNPDFLAELRLLLQRYSFEVIHINNGLHGIGYTEDQYREGLNTLLALLKEEAPDSKLIWCMSTPMRKGEDLTQFNDTNARVVERNRIAREVMEAAGVAVNDLYARVVDHQEFFSADGVHFSPEGRLAQAEQVAATILEQLKQ